MVEGTCGPAVRNILRERTSPPHGGFDNVNPVSFIENNEMWAYDVTNDAWRNASATDGPTIRQSSSAVFIGNKVYIYGGMGPDYAGEPWLSTAVFMFSRRFGICSSPRRFPKKYRNISKRNAWPGLRSLSWCESLFNIFQPVWSEDV